MAVMLVFYNVSMKKEGAKIMKYMIETKNLTKKPKQTKEENLPIP